MTDDDAANESAAADDDDGDGNQFKKQIKIKSKILYLALFPSVMKCHHH